VSTGVLSSGVVDVASLYSLSFTFEFRAGPPVSRGRRAQPQAPCSREQAAPMAHGPPARAAARAVAIHTRKVTRKAPRPRAPVDTRGEHSQYDRAQIETGRVKRIRFPRPRYPQIRRDYVNARAARLTDTSNRHADAAGSTSPATIPGGLFALHSLSCVGGIYVYIYGF
jgi:hypothetical protein